MASKQELGNEIAGLKRANRGLELENASQAAELARLRHEDRRRQEYNRREAQRKREEQQHRERRERRERLDHLGAGRLPLKGAKSWAFVHEQGEQSGIEVFVPLDDEELRVLQEHLQPKPRVATGGIISNHLGLSSRIGEDFLYGNRQHGIRV